MKIEIRRLTPDLAEDYVRFFDETPHNLGAGGQKCYCVTWRSDSSYLGDGDHWFPTEEERRAQAVEFVRSGSLQGYLAYYGGKAVGWCNANGDCRLCIDYLSAYWPIQRPASVKVKSVFCFVVAPEVQRMGIAAQLLERVCLDAAAEGFDLVEGYVSREPGDDFRGPLTMYEKCGFRVSARQDGRMVVQRALKAVGRASGETD